MVSSSAGSSSYLDTCTSLYRPYDRITHPSREMSRASTEDTQLFTCCGLGALPTPQHATSCGGLGRSGGRSAKSSPSAEDDVNGDTDGEHGEAHRGSDGDDRLGEAWASGPDGGRAQQYRYHHHIEDQPDTGGPGHVRRPVDDRGGQTPAEDRDDDGGDDDRANPKAPVAGPNIAPGDLGHAGYLDL